MVTEVTPAPSLPRLERELRGADGGEIAGNHLQSRPADISHLPIYITIETATAYCSLK